MVSLKRMFSERLYFIDQFVVLLELLPSEEENASSKLVLYSTLTDTFLNIGLFTPENVVNVAATEKFLAFHLDRAFADANDFKFAAICIVTKKLYVYKGKKWVFAQSCRIIEDLNLSEADIPDQEHDFDCLITRVIDFDGDAILSTMTELFVLSNSNLLIRIFSNLISAPVLLRYSHKIHDISSGTNHIVILDEKNKVFAFGAGVHGELGLGSECLCVENEFRELPNLDEQIPEGVKAVSTGFNHTLVLTNNGDVYVCGWNRNDNIGPDVPSDSCIFDLWPMDLPSSVVAVRGCQFHTHILYENGNSTVFGEFP